MSLSKEEIKAIEFLFPFLGDNPLVFDVGSNKGDWMDVILNEFKEGCELHSFEPNTILVNFQKIKYDYNTNIIYNDLAVSNTSGKQVDFYYFEDFHNGLSSIINNPKWHEFNPQKKKVLTTTIDDYCSINSVEKIDFLKIDVEGVEALVFKGAKEMLAKDAIKIIQFEYSEHYKVANNKFKDIIDICVPLGYKFYLFEEDNFAEVDTNNFVEDYRFENFFVTKFNIKNESVNGWNAEFIRNTKDLGKFDLVIENGAFEGMTSKYICENLLNDGGRVICIDPHWPYYYDGDNGVHPYFKDQHQRFLRNTKGLPIDLYRKTSKEAYKELHALRAGLTYVDADHRAEHIYHDCVWAFATTKIGGYILIDDVNLWATETKDAVYKFLDEFSSSFDMIEESYQVLIKKKANLYNNITHEFYK